jgi:hypothetical protein
VAAASQPASFERNPMDLVTIKGVSKRSKKPIVLTVEQCLILISF